MRIAEEKETPTEATYPDSYPEFVAEDDIALCADMRRLLKARSGDASEDGRFVREQLRQLLDARLKRIAKKLRAGVPFEPTDGVYTPVLKPNGSLKIVEVGAKCNRHK
jgi:hypothetical protein